MTFKSSLIDWVMKAAASLIVWHSAARIDSFVLKMVSDNSSISIELSEGWGRIPGRKIIFWNVIQKLLIFYNRYLQVPSWMLFLNYSNLNSPYLILILKKNLSQFKNWTFHDENNLVYENFIKSPHNWAETPPECVKRFQSQKRKKKLE